MDGSGVGCFFYLRAQAEWMTFCHVLKKYHAPFHFKDFLCSYLRMTFYTEEATFENHFVSKARSKQVCQLR